MHAGLFVRNQWPTTKLALPHTPSHKGCMMYYNIMQLTFLQLPHLTILICTYTRYNYIGFLCTDILMWIGAMQLSKFE